MNHYEAALAAPILEEDSDLLASVYFYLCRPDTTPGDKNAVRCSVPHPYGLTTWAVWMGDEDGLIAVTDELLEQAPDMPDQLPWPIELVGRAPGRSYWRRTDLGGGVRSPVVRAGNTPPEVS